MMSLGQDEAFYTYTLHTLIQKHLIREACYGGRVGANIRDFESTAFTAILNVIKSQSKSNTEDICNLVQEC